MRKFGLIGKSLSHSFSKAFFEDYFSSNNIEATYSNFEFKNEEELTVFLKEQKDSLGSKYAIYKKIISILYMVI